MTDDERTLELAYMDAMSAIIDVIGIDDGDAGLHHPPSIDLDRLAAPTVNAGRIALQYLLVGTGLLDDEVPLDMGHLSAEDVVAAWARKAK